MFALRSKNLFLTYSQCDLSKEIILEELTNKLSNYGGGVKRYCIGQERHQDGGLHLHAFLELHSRPNGRIDVSTFFDIRGFHPNFQVPRSPKQVLEYCRKEDGNPLTNIENEGSGWAGALQCSNKEEAIAYIRNNFPREFILFNERIYGWADKEFAKKEEEYVSKYNEFNLPTKLIDWSLPTGDRPITTILWGEARLGKTVWARSLGKHIYMRGCVQYDKFLSEYETAEYLILDDLWEWNFRFLKDFIGGQEEVCITGKYRKPITLKWNKPTIILTNETFWYQWDNIQHRKYLLDNSKIINIENKMY